MKHPVKFYSMIFTVCTLLLFSTLQNASAIPIAFDLSSDSEGLSLSYSLPFFGEQDILLAEENDTDTISINIFFIQLANIILTHKGLSNSEESFIDTLNVELKMSFFFGLLKFSPLDVPVPFGDYNMEADLFGTERKALEGDEDMGLSLLLTPDSYEYEIAVDGLPFVEPIDEEGTGDSLTVNVASTNPALFDFDFDIDFTLSPFWFLTRIDMQVDDNATLTLPLPNGAYYIGLDYPDET